MRGGSPTRWFLPDGFMVGMIGAVVLASLFPEFGRSGGPMRADLVSTAGIGLVFFLHGIGLSTESLKAGLSRWKLHLLVQLFTFGVFPLLWLISDVLVGRWVPPALRLGFFYLCALPSTVSSSVAMTALARGNVAAAVFNATLSGLLGIFLTPLWVGLVARTTGETLSLPRAMLDISLLLLAPFVAGQVARPFVGKWFVRFRKYTAVLDKGVILLLVYSSFSDSVASGLWTNYGVETLAITFVGALAILVTVLLLTRLSARFFGFGKEDEIVAVFCGSKKTLVSGVPMARLLFGPDANLGLIVLPIMFYHQLQLALCTVIAGRYARRRQ
ncbi:MAG: bile acid:sodium symporter family protein [Myxococcaceae bacterium]